MRTLYFTSRSPYARKVRIALLEKGLPHSLVTVDLQNRSPAFKAISPIGKVPVLDDEGVVVVDSTVICEYLEDRHPTPPLYGAGWEGRLQSRLLEEYGDTLSDQAVGAFLAKVDLWADAARSGRVERVLDGLTGKLVRGEWPRQFEIGAASLLSALGYLTFRHGDAWRGRWREIAGWTDKLGERPSVAETVPVEG